MQDTKTEHFTTSVTLFDKLRPWSGKWNTLRVVYVETIMLHCFLESIEGNKPIVLFISSWLGTTQFW